ncbi:MAG: DMT family transporter [Christensenellales bacterium]
MNKRRLIPLFAAFVLWGSQYVISKIALRTVPPVTLLALRYLVSVPALFIVLRLRHALTPVKKGDWPILFAIGFTGYFASFCLQMLGINRLTGSVSSLLGAMNPIFIPILAALFLHERITPAKIACVALSMAGVVVIVGVDGTVDASGALLMLASVFLWSTASIIIRRVSGRYDPMQIALIAILCALPLTGGWSLIELQSAPCSFTLESVLAVLYMGVLGTAVTHSLWNYSLRVMDASFCSMFYPMQPLVSSILGVLFLHEAVTPGFVIGALMICCGIVAAVISAKPRKA